MTFFYIEEKRRNGKWKRTSFAYQDYASAKAMVADLDEYGGCGPLRVVAVNR